MTTERGVHLHFLQHHRVMAGTRAGDIGRKDAIIGVRVNSVQLLTAEILGHLQNSLPFHTSFPFEVQYSTCAYHRQP